MSMTLLELRSHLATILAPFLGTFSNGTSAIWVEPPAAPIGNAEGLSCIIQRHKAIKRSESLTSNQIYHSYDWICTLVQFDTTPNGLSLLDSAIAAMQRAFPNHRERSVPYTEDSYPQIAFYINEHAVINQKG